jgi:cell wall-associated NlpC family hydrolase
MPDVNFHQYIGIPYRLGARGPDAYDCYGLICHLLKLDGVNAPDYKSPADSQHIAHAIRSQLHMWAPTELRPGAVPLFRVPGMFHCAYMINAGEFIHTWERSGGVCIEPLSNWTSRLVGIYEYTGD